MTHFELCQDLAHSLQTNFIEVPLGSVWLDRPQIADVINLRPSYTRFVLDIYECKVSRADFLSDIRSKKYEGYLPHCHRFYFAVQSGVATVKDIPDGVGLIIRGEKGWHTVKAPKKREVDFELNMLLSMIFFRERDRGYIRRVKLAQNLRWSHGEVHRVLKNTGKHVKKAIEYMDKYEWVIKEHIKKQQDYISSLSHRNYREVAQ